MSYITYLAAEIEYRELNQQIENLEENFERNLDLRSKPTRLISKIIYIAMIVVICMVILIDFGYRMVLYDTEIRLGYSRNFIASFPHLGPVGGFGYDCFELHSC